jgi:hypothetical protein
MLLVAIAFLLLAIRTLDGDMAAKLDRARAAGESV